MSIPRQFLITVEMGKATELGQAVRSARPLRPKRRSPHHAAPPLPMTQIAAANLDLTAPKHCFLCAFVLVDRQNPRSFFQPYYGACRGRARAAPFTPDPAAGDWTHGEKRTG